MLGSCAWDLHTCNPACPPYRRWTNYSFLFPGQLRSSTHTPKISKFWTSKGWDGWTKDNKKSQHQMSCGLAWTSTFGERGGMSLFRVWIFCPSKHLPPITSIYVIKNEPTKSCGHRFHPAAVVMVKTPQISHEKSHQKKVDIGGEYIFLAIDGCKYTHATMIFIYFGCIHLSNGGRKPLWITMAGWSETSDSNGWKPSKIGGLGGSCGVFSGSSR